MYSRIKNLSTALADYFAASMKKIQTDDVLHHFGLLAKAVATKA